MQINYLDLWKTAEEGRIQFKVSAGKLPRSRCPPRRIDSGSEATNYETPLQFFRIQYYLVLDKIILSIHERFDSSAWKIMNSMERLRIHSICGEKLNDVDVNIVLNHLSGD